MPTKPIIRRALDFLDGAPDERTGLALSSAGLAITMPAPATSTTMPMIGETGKLSFFSVVAWIGPTSRTFSCLVKVM